MSKDIWHLAGGGLGNRLRGAILAYHYARRFDVTLNCYWPKTHACLASAEDLFDNGDLFWRTSASWHDNYLYFFHYKPHKIPSHFYKHDELSEKKMYDLIGRHSDRICFGGNDISPIASLESKNDFFKRALVPKKHILDEVEFFCQNQVPSLTKYNTIGCHFRATDNGVGNEVQNCLQRVESLVNENEKKPFHRRFKHLFICSDSKEIEDAICEKFPLYAIRYPKTEYVKKYDEGRDWADKVPAEEGEEKINTNILRSSQSVVEAFVDCLILSKTGGVAAGSPWENLKSRGTFYLLAIDFSCRWEN